jgi:cytochrome c-type biogenesis protein CcmH
MRKLVLILCLLLVSIPAFAVEPDEMLKDPALEARARELSQQLRCMVCQNQSLADSNAQIARDLRREVLVLMRQGKSNQEIQDYLVARYGEFVLLKPAFAWHNALLWAIPPGVLLIGAVALFVIARRRRAADAQAPLDEAEQRKLAAMLDEPGR